MIFKQQKKEILDELEAMSSDHESIKTFYLEGDAEVVLTLLQSCQEKAIEIGNTIESLMGEGFVTVKYLEEYCEVVYETHGLVSAATQVSPSNIEKKLNKSILKVINSVKNDIQVKKEAVFLPYKASMWDALETVWRRYDADPDWNAVVVPIPYYDRNPDGSFSAMHYEGNEFPKDVPITMYNKYEFKENHPDEIYIINPYDGNNFVTSVEPFFYSTNLKQFTDCLVYIPYFVLGEPDINQAADIANLEHFVLTPGVLNANKIILQSENMKEAYLKVLTAKFGENTRKIWNDRIEGTGSPKFEKLIKTSKSDVVIPDEWELLIKKPDGSDKKIVLYNTGIAGLLEAGESMIGKISRVIATFYEHREEIVLWWRPHPLIEATLTSMRPDLWEAYKVVRDKYIEDGFGIFDDSPDMDRALIYSDAYYGDGSSLVELYKKTGKPIMIQSATV